MARPRKGEERNATAQIAARIPAVLRTRLDALVRQRQSDITAEVTEALESHIGETNRCRHKGKKGPQMTPEELASREKGE